MSARRVCSGCGFPVKQGFIKKGKLVCGQTEMFKTVKRNGEYILKEVKTPRCKY